MHANVYSVAEWLQCLVQDSNSSHNWIHAPGDHAQLQL